jgi:hypothetical protein
MNKRIAIKRAVIVLICTSGFLFVGYKSCLLLNDLFGDYPGGIGTYSLMEDYAFDPETILPALGRGTTTVFTPAVATPEADWVPPVSFHWRQADYLKIAGAFYQFKWNENINTWHLYSMKFRKDCANNSDGFYLGKIAYFKDSDETSHSHYLFRELSISPMDKELTWEGDVFRQPPLFGWFSIDQIKISADDALEIAEKNGGKEARLKVKNACTIYVSIIPNPDRDYKWRVSYDSYDTFEIQIDPYSGSHNIVERIR